MDRTEQLPLMEQGPAVLAKFEARLRALRQSGLTLWTGVLRNIFNDLRRERSAERAAVYEQCMLLEAEIEAGADSVVLLDRLGRIKGLVAACLLGLCVYQALETHGAFRPRESRALRVPTARNVRSRKGRDGEEFFLA